MIPRFELATAVRIVFGAGTLAEVPGAVRDLGARRALLVRGRSPERAAGLAASLAAAGVELVSLAVAGEPTVELAREGAALARAERCDAVVAFGGGSVVDAGKAVAALATNPGDPLDYLEVVGRGQPLAAPSLPFVAIPSTAGTGSEVTRNAVLGSKAARVKASLRSPLMLPRIAVVDPDLLVGAPPAVLASSGLDALSQLVEPFLSARANPLTDALARDGIARSARSLRRAVLGELDPAARDDLALASLFGGLCLANSGLGCVHGFAAPLGGMFDAPHGALCAVLLGPVLDANLAALRARAPAHPSIDRIREVAVLLTGDGCARADDASAWVRRLCADLAIPPLSRHGMRGADVATVVEKAKAASSTKANPVVLTDEELAGVLRSAGIE